METASEAGLMGLTRSTSESQASELQQIILAVNGASVDG
jgi:hypothetical protein